jgi:CHASE1-domain containing sensor protein
MIALVVPLWLATTFVTARIVYSRTSRRRERDLERLADRLASIVAGLVADERRALRRPSP